MAQRVYIQQSLVTEIETLQQEVSRRQDNLSAVEAKVFYDYLSSLSERLVANRIQMEENDKSGWYGFDLNSKIARETHLKVILLQADLVKVCNPKPNEASTSSTSSTESQREKSLIRIQKSLVQEIESLESIIRRSPFIKKIDAEVMLNHLDNLSERYMINHDQLIAMKISQSALDDQLAISREIRMKVMQLEIILKNAIEVIGMSSRSY